MNKYTIGGLIVGFGLFAVILGFFLKPSNADLNQTLRDGFEKMANALNIPLGATPGADLDSKYSSRGGVKFYHESQAMTATSSVLCAFQNPFAPATTTIDKIVAERRSGFTAATLFDISTSTTRFGSSTVALIRAKSVAAAGKDTTIWVPRNSTSSVPTNTNTLFWNEYGAEGSPFIVKGTEWITIRNATGTPGSETLTGDCSFEGTKTGR